MTFNLTKDPWIPALDSAGRRVMCSLQSLYERAAELTDLDVQAHERISVMRLLLCITQRALDGPESIDDREDCREQIVPKSLAYLRQWESAFELFPIGKEGAFLQFADVQGGETDISKLHMTCAAGNNSTLFDNAGGMRPQLSSAAQIALDLLTYQNFSPCGKIGVATWAGKKTGVKSPDASSNAPCVLASALHLFLVGKNLLETLNFNLIPKESLPHSISFGTPVWEQMPKHMQDEEAVHNAIHSYLGRLVPVSRTIRIASDCRSCVLAHGLRYTAEDEGELLYYEQSMTITIDKDNKRTIVSADLSRAIWRSLPALLHRFSKQNRPYPPHRLQPPLFENEQLEDGFSFWVGAMVCDNAKILDTMSDIFADNDSTILSLPYQTALEKLIRCAEFGDVKLREALDSYITSTNKAQHDKTKRPDPVAKLQNKVSQLYWDHMLEMKPYLICIASRCSQATSEEQMAEAAKPWASRVEQAAKLAFESYAVRSTTRELCAWAESERTLPHLKGILKYITNNKQ